MKILTTTTIEELYKNNIITLRAYHCCTDNGLTTVGALCQYEQEHGCFCRMRNCGKKSDFELKRITAICEDYDLRPDTHTPLPPTKRAIQKEAKGTDIRHIILHHLARAYHLLPDSERLIYENNYGDPHALLERMERTSEALLQIDIPYTPEEKAALRQTSLKVITHLCQQLKQDGYEQQIMAKMMTTHLLNLQTNIEGITFEDKLRAYCTPAKEHVLQRTYEQMCQPLTARTKNFQQTYHKHFRSLIAHWGDSLKRFLTLNGGKRKTATEFHALISRFKTQAEDILRLDEQETLKAMTCLDYPFLNAKQQDFVVTFKAKHGHEPMLYIMLQYLRQSGDRSDRIYAMYYGLNNTSALNTKQIAKSLRLTRERIRQIMTTAPAVTQCPWLTRERIIPYTLSPSPIISVLTPGVEHFMATELSGQPFLTFCGLYAALFDYKCHTVKQRPFLIKSQWLQATKVAINDIDLFSAGRFAQHHTAPLSQFLPPPLQDSPEMLHIMTTICREALALDMSSTHNINFKQNDIDISNELYNILNEEGRPMHITGIFQKFKQRYPYHRYTEAMQIKPYLYKHQHITTIGKKSTYALAHWSHIYRGNIRHLIRETLEQAPTPLHLDRLTEIVRQHYPETNKASLAASLYTDRVNGFVAFKGSHYGLKSKQYAPEYTIADQRRLSESFDRRLSAFEAFLDSHQRFPFTTGSPEESTLRRWYYNVTHNNLDVSQNQIRQLLDLAERYAHLPFSASEYQFRQRCRAYRDFVNTHGRLPKNQDKEAQLYAWGHKAALLYVTYDDKRKAYFEELQTFLSQKQLSINKPTAQQP